MASRTVLYAQHLALGARMVEFAGWEMPVQYSGVLEEHRACRARAALFDICHMGELELVAPDVRAALNALLTADYRRVPAGAARYAFLLNAAGGILDDLIAFVRDDRRAMIVTNAANTAPDFAALKAALPSGARLVDRSPETAKLDLQGPRAREILSRVLDAAPRAALAGLRYFRFFETARRGAALLVSRSGYTGELGYELFLPAEAAVELWQALLDAGRADGLLPAGLGARDTLRLEAALPLYGHEMDASVTPDVLGALKYVSLEKPEKFPGRAALEKRLAAGPPARILAGIELLERGVPRAGYLLREGGREVGKVTSGTLSPTLDKGIALAHLDRALAVPGRRLALEVRGRELAAAVTALPFYQGSVRA